jgi:hypothetical protein
MSLIPGVSVPLKSIISRLVKIFEQQIFAVKKSKANNLCSYSKTLEDIRSEFRILYTKVFKNVTRGNSWI